MCVCPVLLHVNENIFGPERCAEQGGTVNMGNVLVCKVSRDLDSCHSYTARAQHSNMQEGIRYSPGETCKGWQILTG